jgi:hypothetical protein
MDSYGKKIADLEAEINKLDAQMPTSEQSPKKSLSFSLSELKYYLIGGGLAPIIYLGLLYLIAPSFVYSSDENGKKEFSKKKWLVWTSILTLLTWVSFYLYIYVEV